METNKIDYSRANFVMSAPDIGHLKSDTGLEIAFAGRSNAGKSSALNCLTGRKSLARTSKTPGRTQLINIFDLGDDKRFVDLPGYGFAQVPLEVKKKWQRSLSEYLQKRKSLVGIVIFMDIRHPLKDSDMQMIEWAVYNELPTLALLTKSDKLKHGAAQKQLLGVRKELSEWKELIQVETFSSLKGSNKEKVLNVLTDWLTYPDDSQDEPEDVSE